MENASAAELLNRLLKVRLAAEQYSWMQERLSLASGETSLRDVHISFGLIPRRFGRQDLAATDEEAAEADSITSGWSLSDWTIDMAARVLLLCTIAQKSHLNFGELFKSIGRTADLVESITLYKAIIHYPPSEELDEQIGEGLRSNIRAVFEAIAHNNPYPAIHFSELRWNHMVLKALFVESLLQPIQGLDARANPELTRILCDYAHERWAAHRPVTPELWRCVGPFAKGNMLDDLQRALESEHLPEQQGAILALSNCPDPRAQTLLKQYPEHTRAVANGELSWDSIAREISLHS